MLLKIQNFRCYQNSVFEFLEGSVNLISGDSGVGKTTILKALKWCLFGKIKSVANNAEMQLNPHYKPKTCVSLSWDKYCITRSKNPEVLSFFDGTTKWESEVAQNLINDIFGNYKIWDATSNLDQGSLNSLITESEKDKIELLQILSFSGEDPEIIKDKITTAIAKTKIEFEKIQIEYGVEMKLYEDFASINKERLDVKYHLQEQTLFQFQKDMQSNEVEIKKLEEDLIQYDINMAIGKTYEHRKSEIVSKLGNTQYISLEDKNKELETLDTTIKEYTTFLTQHKKYIAQETKINILKDRLSQLPETKDLNNIKSAIESTNNYLQQLRTDLIKLKEKDFYYTEIVKYKNQLSQCKYTNNINEIEEKIETLRGLKISYKNKNNKIELLEKLKADKNKILMQLNQMPIFDLTGIQSKITEYSNFLKYESVSISNTQYINELNLLNSKLADLKIPTDIYLNLRFTETQIAELETQTLIYIKNLELAKELGINYDRGCINAEIEKLKYILELQPEIEKKITAEILKLKISQINVFGSSKDEINEIRRKIEAMKASNNILQCPHCTANLKLYNSQLIKSEQKSYTQEEIIEYTGKLAKMETDELLYTQKSLLEWELTNLGIVKNVDVTLQLASNLILEYNNRLLNLQKITIINTPLYDVNLAKNNMNYWNLVDKITDISAKIIPGIPQYNNWEILKKDLISLEENLVNAKNWDIYKTNLTYSLKDTEEKIVEIVIPDLPIFEESELTDLENILITAKTENLRYENLSKSIKDIQDKAGTIETKNLITNIENEININTQKLESLTLDLTLSEKYIHERNLINIELSSFTTIEFNANYVNLGITEDTICNLEIKIKILKNEISEITVSNSLWKNYTTELEDIKIKISNINLDHSIQNRLKSCKEILETQKVHLENHFLYVEYYKKYLYITQFREKVVQVQTTLADLHELHKHAIHVERECLESTVSQINTDLFNICSTIFDSDIEVLLALYKPLKKGDEKESVNVHILNKGIKYDFKELSGGQQARVSLALTLALSLTSNSPVIILDEALTSLDTTSREKCLKIIKHYTQKTVIMINHMEIEGLYEHIIKL